MARAAPCELHVAIACHRGVGGGLRLWVVKLSSALMTDLVGHVNQTNETSIFTAPLPATHDARSPSTRSHAVLHAVLQNRSLAMQWTSTTPDQIDTRQSELFQVVLHLPKTANTSHWSQVFSAHSKQTQRAWCALRNGGGVSWVAHLSARAVRPIRWRKSTALSAKSA